MVNKTGATSEAKTPANPADQRAGILIDISHQSHYSSGQLNKQAFTG
jgi:hypothetical protein